MKNETKLLVAIVLILIMEGMAFNITNLKKENSLLLEENSQLTEQKCALQVLNDEYESSYIETIQKELECIEPFRLSNKQEYLGQYKEIMKEAQDPPETIYDYTTNEEFKLLCQVVQAESGICDFNGKVNVATTIINRYFSEIFPNGWNELLFQKECGVYQYSTIQNKSYLSQDITQDTIEAIEYAFLFGSEVEDSTYFHSGSSSWHENNLELIYEDAWHKFYKEENMK